MHCEHAFLQERIEITEFYASKDNNFNSKSQICNYSTGSYTCTCNSGYFLSNDNRGCSNINECAAGTHNCNLACIGNVLKISINYKEKRLEAYMIYYISYIVYPILNVCKFYVNLKIQLVHINAPLRVIDGLEVQ